MIRQPEFLFLLALLAAGGGLTAGVRVVMPSLEYATADRSAEVRPEPVASATVSPPPSAPAAVVAQPAKPAARVIENAPPEAPKATGAQQAALPSQPTQSEPPVPVVSYPAEPTIADLEPETPKPTSEQHAAASAQPAASEPPQADVGPVNSQVEQSKQAELAPVLTPSAPPLTAPDMVTPQVAALTPPSAIAPPEPAAQPASLGPMTQRPDVPLPPQRPPELTSEANALATDLFSHVKLPSSGPAHVVGFYSAGCIAGAKQLPLQGRNWQVMRPSRDRYWGHPKLINFIERVAQDVSAHSNWPGILIGDMAQPRGGPLPAGHASHQIGLDVDIWLKPMPKEPYSRSETESVPMVSVVAADNKQLDKRVWQPEDATLIKIAAEQPEVDRIFVNPVIKKELCRTKKAADESWMTKVRPWYGHDEHIHVRLKCPADSPDCREQAAVPDGDGCGKALEHWFKPGILAVEERLRTQAPVKRTTQMRALPTGCFAVLHAPAATDQVAATASRAKAPVP